MYMSVIFSYYICRHPQLKHKPLDTARDEEVGLKTKEKKPSQA
jgi:hypothetical protein